MFLANAQQSGADPALSDNLLSRGVSPAYGFGGDAFEQKVSGSRYSKEQYGQKTGDELKYLDGTSVKYGDKLELQGQTGRVVFNDLLQQTAFHPDNFTTEFSIYAQVRPLKPETMGQFKLLEEAKPVGVGEGATPRDHTMNEKHDAVICLANKIETTADSRHLVLRTQSGDYRTVDLPRDWRKEVSNEDIANAKEYEHFFEHCKTEIAPKAGIEDSDAFCAWLKSRVEGTDWRHDKKSANERFQFVANAQAYPTGAGGWIQIAPFGIFDNPQGKQCFTNEDAQKIVSWFNSPLTRASALGLLGIPFYVGHPDHPRFTDKYKDTTAKGRIKELQIREDGLWGRVKWNGDGSKLIADEAFHGHSVNWAVDKQNGLWHPYEIKSVGFTNEPAIPVLPITTANENNIMETKMHPGILKALGMPDTATEDDVSKKIGEHMDASKKLADEHAQLQDNHKVMSLAYEGLKKGHSAFVKSMANAFKKHAAPEDGEPDDMSNEKCEEWIKKVEARVAKSVTETETLDKQVKQLTKDIANEKTSVATERKERAALLISQAIKEGRLTGAEKPDWEKNFANEFDKTSEALSKKTQQYSTGSGVQVAGRAPEVIRTMEERTRKVQSFVNEAMTSDEVKRKTPAHRYDAAWEKVQREHPELFKDMIQPEGKAA